MIELHLAGYQPARSVHTRALHALRESVARRAGEALRINVTDNIVAQGRKASDLLTMVDSGELDGCYFASSYLAGRVPGLGLFDQPFQAGSREDVFGALDGDAGASLADELAAATGYRVIGWWDNGIRHISNSIRPIRTPADCAGLRIRTLDNAQTRPRCIAWALFRRSSTSPICRAQSRRVRSTRRKTRSPMSSTSTCTCTTGISA
ncbi:MAG: TRAP transporter substrate-binding protein DctP [Acetobacteraceae bacterium]